MELFFYKQPFVQANYGTWVYDAKNNFVFQFDEKIKYNNDGELLESVNLLREKIIFSLNSVNLEPIEGLDLSINPDNPVEILNNGELFITIRGWGNLTGIGGYKFDTEKATFIQDLFAQWLIYKTCS